MMTERGQLSADGRGRTLYIIGVCGTAMAAIAVLARGCGWRVSGSDHHVYPPMSDYLAREQISLLQGYDAEHLQQVQPDLVLIGNALSRGNVEVEAVLNRGLPYCSGAQFVGDALLVGRTPFVVAGTHGKTTTASLLAHLLHEAGRQPGMMIGGVPHNFGGGARLGEGEPFVLEGDEYDTAFFDKRSKFLHYHAKILILNNLEFDHADIFPDLAAIQRQFSHLLRTVPNTGVVVVNGDDRALAAVLQQGCWTPTLTFSRWREGGDAVWQWRAERADGSRFSLYYQGEHFLKAVWSMLGEHHVANACAAVAACVAYGIDAATLKKGLESFAGVERRMTLVGEARGVQVFDDFAHHPTAIRGVVAAMRARMDSAGGSGRLWVVVEPRSNTMRSQVHQQRLCHAFDGADQLYLLRPKPSSRVGAALDVEAVCHAVGDHAVVVADVASLLPQMAHALQPGDVVLALSNGGLDGFHQRLLALLSQP